MVTNACRHQDWTAHAVLLRDYDDDGRLVGRAVEFTMTCAACLTPMQWLGLPVGPSSFLPAVAEPAAITAVLRCQPFDVAKGAPDAPRDRPAKRNTRARR